MEFMMLKTKQNKKATTFKSARKNKSPLCFFYTHCTKMETISVLPVLRSKMECLLPNFGAVELPVLSTCLPEVGLFLSLSVSEGSLQSIFRTVLQPVLLCVPGCVDLQ